MTEEQNPPSSQPAPVTGIGGWLFLFSLAALIILADQVTKAYVVAHLPLHESWMPVGFIDPLFRFTHVHNTGAAFGMFSQGSTILLGVALIVSAVIIYYYRQIPARAWLIRLALGLQLGGALGNVVDRIRTGYVVDFFHLAYLPVFNVADMCIVTGVSLLALQMLLDEWQTSRQKKAAKDQRPADEKSVGN